MRWFVLMLLCAFPVFAAEPGEAEAFAAAAKASQDGFFDRAESAWSEFLKKYPNSERANEAALAQAQVRHQLKQFPAALEILKARGPNSGAIADQYKFWEGQTLLDAGDFPAAEATFADFLKSFTNSPLRLNASVAQGLGRFRRNDLAGVADLLAPANSPFQETARASTNIALAARGYLTLAEAQLRRGDHAAARAGLQPLSGKQLPAELDWERWQLLARIELLAGAPDQAAVALTNALNQARAANRPVLQAQVLNLEAETFLKLNLPARAAASYEAIVATPGLPPDDKRAALLKQVELAAQSSLTNAAGRIAVYLAQNTNDVAVDLLTIKAGEFLLEAYRQQTNKAAGPATNLVAEARGYFDSAIQRYTNSPLLGRAWLNRGWTLWEEHLATGNGQRLADCQTAFASAVEKLPAGEERAQARLKLGDAQFQQGLHGAAATNFLAVLQSFETEKNFSTNVAAQAAEQLIRSELARTNLAGAEIALQKTIGLFPGAPHAEASWLAVSQASADSGDLEKARGLARQFPEKFPNSTKRADAELVYARTFALERKWPEAIDLYSKWTSANTNHHSLPQAEFDRAWHYFRAGQNTNAFQLFTNFVVRFPANELAALAQNWLGDFYFNQEQWPLAEQNYQRVFQSTNWNLPDLACQARLMAARTAYFRQGYADAKSYLTNLIVSPCSPEIVAEAWFILGDVLIQQRAASSTNALSNFSEALEAFLRVTRMGPTNRFEPLAWGKIGDCHFQLATAYPESYLEATNAYRRALDSKRTDVPIAARNQAEVGIGLTLEKMAESRPKERDALIKAALQHHLNVVYGEGLSGPRPDPFWQRRAALTAGRISEAINPEAARQLYQRLMTEIPAMKATWKAKLDALPPEPLN